MSGFFKKIILKWSAISVLGLGAYFLGFSQGLQTSTDLQAKLQSRTPATQNANKDVNQDAKNSDDSALIVLPNSLSATAPASVTVSASEKPTHLSQLK